MTFDRQNISQFIGYLAYFVALIYYILTNSAIVFPISLSLKAILLVTTCLAALKFIFQNDFDFKILYIIVSFFCVSVFCAYYSHDLNPIILTLVLFTANDLNIDKLTQITYRTIFITLFLLFFLSLSGMLADYQYFRNGQLRHSFGTSQPTVFSAMTFFGIAAYIYNQRNKLNYIHYIVLVLIIMLINHYTKSRNDTVSMFLLLFVPLIAKSMEYKGIGQVMKFLVIFSYPLNALFVYFVTARYSINNGIYYGIDLNEILSNRLYYGKLALNLYHIKLFGQHFEMYGNGGGRIYINPNQYFFVDSSYLYILLRYGLIFSLILIGWFVWHSFKLIRCNSYFLATLIAIVGFESAWQLTLTQYVNVFILCLTIPIFKRKNAINSDRYFNLKKVNT
ncbi:hypothetical protein [Heyndrickxia coagulans]|jgi:uncharacterized membrane protein|uniref:hypothetical protein n=1 Tax=Heyndrickxia coagulans TaxID=1398 RepID=UPI00041DA4B7|nr:hypothetical protein [Heyndrickxia coagulans]